jgi:hypothetical protein
MGSRLILQNLVSSTSVKNVRGECKSHILNILEVHTPLNHRKYIELLSLIGRNKRVVFSFIRDRL